jgi:murein tripeptide amidase MpaA
MAGEEVILTCVYVISPKMIFRQVRGAD